MRIGTAGNINALKNKNYFSYQSESYEFGNLKLSILGKNVNTVSLM